MAIGYKNHTKIPSTDIPTTPPDTPPNIKIIDIAVIAK
jgi:hypothetical protein